MKLLSTAATVVAFVIGGSLPVNAAPADYKADFISPKESDRSIIIWQWMDGLVSKESITRDLEAFKAAGLSGVQNFQIGGDRQIRVGDPSCAIGSDKWKEMMRWAIMECGRLGLSFGTHNCPGWSSSAYRSVTPEYSMQKLVFSEVTVSPRQLDSLMQAGSRLLPLPRPEIDPAYDYYQDIAVLAFPCDSVIQKADIVDLTSSFADGSLADMRAIPVFEGRDTRLVRFGHTTNGKTNESQSPVSGRGLECDKMRREAVKAFWDAYPAMIVDLAGNLAGTVFTRLEIDSYEAGGQDWSVVLPDEFRMRKKYDIIPYLPVLAGCALVESKKESGRFMKDLEDVVTSLFAENYYGYMNELASRTPGLNLLIEPYGTGGQKPFRVLDIYKILENSPGAIMATEFWVKPDWGWKDMRRHEKVVRQLGRGIMYAEGFTCWPLHAWQDDPNSLKPICDRAYCTGVNRMMLHAGAVNPWPGVEPGMSFGIWGTQFVPAQTWWKAGGAKGLFEYMARCQSLLQRGVPAKEQAMVSSSFQSYHRVDGNNDILFLCNPTDSVVTSQIDITHLAAGRRAELWDPYAVTMSGTGGYVFDLAIEPSGSRFIIISDETAPAGVSTVVAENCLVTSMDMGNAAKVDLDGEWMLKFPTGNDDRQCCRLHDLKDWTELPEKDHKYFSGTATYSTTFKLDRKQLAGGRIILDLGEVDDMAAVRVNSVEFPPMWKAPYLIDITSALKKGSNTMEIDVTNLWVNRMVGDEQEPDDLKWSEPLQYTYAPGSPVAGHYLAEIPDWLANGTERPSVDRKTVVGFKFFNSASPLLPSGLKGPVRLWILPEN